MCALNGRIKSFTTLHSILCYLLVKSVQQQFFSLIFTNERSVLHRVMRRHQRHIDHYQTQEKFFDIFERIKIAVYPKGVSDEDFRKLLYAIQYAERHPEKESNSGRRARFDATFLFNSSLKIKSVLQNETGGRISLARFITTYLPIPNYPHDIQTALNNHKINLEEARILARINREALGDAVKRKPSEIRREIIDSHIKRLGTQLELKKRVDER